jgi:hypothetical protein
MPSQKRAWWLLALSAALAKTEGERGPSGDGLWRLSLGDVCVSGLGIWQLLASMLDCMKLF